MLRLFRRTHQPRSAVEDGDEFWCGGNAGCGRRARCACRIHCDEPRCRAASRFGIGAVAIRNTSHFGPAGAYSLEAARQGFIGITFCNSDSFVRLHDGAQRFHGTNPIAVGVPSGGSDPWLLDMATIPSPIIACSCTEARPAFAACDSIGRKGSRYQRCRCGGDACAARRRVRIQRSSACRRRGNIQCCF